jgi:hypothetical protein
MAQHFNIPIAFKYLASRAKWESCSFLLADEESVFRPKSPTATLGTPVMPESDKVYIRLNRVTGLAALTAPSEPFYKTYSSELIVALQIMFERQESGLPLLESMAQLLVTSQQGDIAERHLDPWKMCDEFMRLEESNAALRSFLNRWGIWDTSSTISLAAASLKDVGLGLVSYESPILCVLPFLVWRARKAFRAGMLGKPDAWLANNASFGMTHRRSQFPYLGITDRDCSKAIETTITLDHMRQVKRSICARSDCDNIFEVESGHGKIYCEQYCGHLVSVRRKREAEKRARKAARPKGV